jgi:hypothetical protein
MTEHDHHPLSDLGGESAYWDAGRELIEQREAAGRMKDRRLGADGTLVEDWQDAPPPPSRSAGSATATPGARPTPKV